MYVFAEFFASSPGGIRKKRVLTSMQYKCYKKQSKGSRLEQKGTGAQFSREVLVDGMGKEPQDPQDEDLLVEFVDHTEEPHRVSGGFESLATEGAPEAEAPITEGERLAKLEDQLLRQKADFENYRRRVTRELAEAGEKAKSAILKEFLPVLDNMDRALAILEQEAPAEWCRGMELVHQTFAQTLTRAGAEPIDALGQPFSPQVHDAISLGSDDSFPDGAVMDVVERGYTLNGKLLRPARVRVNRLNPQPPEGAAHG